MISKFEPPAASLTKQGNLESGYNLAFKLAVEKLKVVRDINALCKNSESACGMSGGARTIQLCYLNRKYQVVFPDIDIFLSDRREPVALSDKILILHYLNRAKGTPLSNKFIAYKELQEGSAYFPSFFIRSIKPLVENFGENPELLLTAAEELGGYRAKLGDASVTIPAFSRVPVTLIVWGGDEEFQPNANILFDSTILDYLSPEDVNVLCQTLVWRLVKLLKNQSITTIKTE
jgi:hypothetical protein